MAKFNKVCFHALTISGKNSKELGVESNITIRDLKFERFSQMVIDAEGNSQTEKELRPHEQLSSGLFIVDVEFFVSVCAGGELQFIAIETKAGKT